ncbi:GroES-like protein [Fomes fomentarius]|nr:GroES-like protein [Fomes fomentarius]
MPQQQTLLLSAPSGEYTVHTTDSIPTPSSGQVLVKVVVAALNPADWKINKFNMYKDYYPLTLGMEGAGIVEDIASDVKSFNKGDRIVFQAYIDDTALEGTFRRYLAIPAYLAAKIPDNLSFEQGATLPIELGTIALPLYSAKPEVGSLGLSPPWEAEGRGKYAGKSAFVPGGASQVGLFALQFLKLSGFGPIIATASAHNFELVKAYGATHVIDRKLPTADVVKQVTAIAGGGGVDLVYDAISTEDTLALSEAVARPGSQLVCVTPPLGEFVAKLAADKRLQVAVAQGSMSIEKNRGGIDGLLEKLPQLLQDGLLKPTSFEVVPGGLNGVESGLNRLEKDQVSGVKLVVRLDDTQ